MGRIDFASPQWMYQEPRQQLNVLERKVLSFGVVAYKYCRMDALPDGHFDYDAAQQLLEILWDEGGFSTEAVESSRFYYCLVDFDGTNILECIEKLNDFDTEYIENAAKRIVSCYDRMKGIN